MSVMAVAAPGADPQTAVVPGRTRQRVRNPPRVAAAATTEATPSRKIGQLRPISAKMESGALRAITQPNIPCAKKNGWGGTRVSPIVVAVAMAAIMDPREALLGDAGA